MALRRSVALGVFVAGWFCAPHALAQNSLTVSRSVSVVPSEPLSSVQFRLTYSFTASYQAQPPQAPNVFFTAVLTTPSSWSLASGQSCTRNSSTVTCTATSGQATMAVDVFGAATVVINVGAFAYGPGVFLYGQAASLSTSLAAPAPTISGFSPTQASANSGQPITINGTYFQKSPDGTQVPRVTFGGNAPINATWISSSQLTAPVPLSGGTYSVRVTNPDGQSALASGSLVIVSGPVITSVTPNPGPLAGNWPVTISGTGFAAGATVKFGANSATAVTIVNATTITATVPAGNGIVNVTVTNPDSQVGTLTNGFTYVGPPTISSVSPAAGPVNAARSVTISGTNLVAGTTVRFGGVAATSVSPLGTTLTCVTPALAAGTVDVLVTAPGGSATKTAAYSYLNPPTIASLSQISGLASGGQSITVTGTNFVPGMSVSFGGTNGAVTSVPDSAHAVVTTPAHAAGTVNVVVTTPGGSATLTSAYTFVGLPTIGSVTPNAGPLAGNWPVTISGTGFAAGATVTFGTNSATSVTFVNATTITARAPAGAGIVNVTVTNPFSQAGSLINGFTYRPAPTVTSVSPGSGRANSATFVSVSGTGFVPGAAVAFGGGAATNVAFQSSTSLTAYTPALGAGSVAITVTNPEGQAGTLASGYTYLPVPTLSSVSPTSGSPVGGFSVTAYGAGFVAGAAVALSGVSASNVHVDPSGGWLSFTAPVHGPGNVSVVVTNPNGMQTIPGGGFTYVGPTTSFYTAVSCRIYGPSTLSARERRVVSLSACGIPATAKALAVNYTVTDTTGAGTLAVMPNGVETSSAIALYFKSGVARACLGIVPLAWDASGTVLLANNSDGSALVIIDVAGYFQ